MVLKSCLLHAYPVTNYRVYTMQVIHHVRITNNITNIDNYMQYFNYQKAMPSPWGKVDSKYLITKGVYDVGTPGHGGIMVGKKIAKKLLSDKARKIGFEWNNYICFEEDCDWAAFAYEQPTLYANSLREHAIKPEKITTEYIKRQAEDSLKRYYPDFFV